MENEQFDLVFSGELVPGFELAQVKKNLQALFRINEAKAEMMFSGRSIKLKKGVNAEAANRYRIAMKKAGARVSVERSAAPPGDAVKATTSAAPTLSPAPAQQTNAHQEGGPENNPASPLPRPSIEAPDFPLAEVGADMLRAEERQQVVPVEVDTSALAVEPQEGNLVSADELARAAPVNVNIPSYEVAPVGSDVLKPEERKGTEEAEVDTSALSLAEVGARMAPEKPEAPPAPNVSHIKLAD